MFLLTLYKHFNIFETKLRKDMVLPETFKKIIKENMSFISNFEIPNLNPFLHKLLWQLCFPIKN